LKWADVDMKAGTITFTTTAFGRLARNLGLADLRFHDLRHDAASMPTMAGVPQRTIMALLGHRDPRMTLRYQHLSPEHFRDAVRTLDRNQNGGPNGTRSNLQNSSARLHCSVTV